MRPRSLLNHPKSRHSLQVFGPCLQKLKWQRAIYCRTRLHYTALPWLILCLSHSFTWHKLERYKEISSLRSSCRIAGNATNSSSSCTSSQKTDRRRGLWPFPIKSYSFWCSILIAGRDSYAPAAIHQHHTLYNP